MLSRSTQNKPIIRHASILLACFGAMSLLALTTLHVTGYSRGITFSLCARSCPNALIKLPNDQDRKAEVAYTRQRQAADRVVQLMRAKPDDWERSSYHRPTKALWIDPFRDFYQCPAVLEKVGSMSDGGKWVCGVDSFLQRPSCVVYSFGSKGDTSFEESIIENTACSVWTFDPTLSKQDAAKVSAVSGLEYTAVGLSDKDGEMDINGIVRPVRSLATLMKERGHTWIDVLKMDIEGAEWAVLNAFIEAKKPLPVTQAQIEFHVRKPGDAIETMSGLLGLGMRVFHVEENNYCASCPGKLYEVALARVDLTGRMVRE